jgi:hypothetical protein
LGAIVCLFNSCINCSSVSATIITSDTILNKRMKKDLNLN